MVEGTTAKGRGAASGTGLPGGRGGYALVIKLQEPLGLPVGALGAVTLPSGYCLYFGSAMSGLAARVARHLRRRKRLHWHIDYLTSVALPLEVWWAECGHRTECHWAAAALLLPGASAPAPGFGASDCRCGSHLVHVGRRPSAADLRALLGPRWSGVIQVLPTGAGCDHARGAGG
ncbi:MAG: GIY-YIG nuclease family protein [Gemmatimonadetes bacterium]|nr:GIY-YIG nuclease family protein [Gemmatimonadota bacterium]